MSHRIHLFAAPAAGAALKSPPVAINEASKSDNIAVGGIFVGDQTNPNAAAHAGAARTARAGLDVGRPARLDLLALLRCSGQLRRMV